MAAFTYATAEARCIAKTLDNTWHEAYVANTPAGVIIVRALRKLSTTTDGGWVDLTDDAAV